MDKPKPGAGGKVNTPDYYHYYYSQPLNGPSRTFTPATPAQASAAPQTRPAARTTTIDVKVIAMDTLKFTKELVKKKIFYKVLAWLLVFWFFVKIEFGAVFVVITGFALIFFNLGERKKGEESAYNVFNKNHRELLGTLNARHFENELMSRHDG